jgi:CRISPR-associated endonuclease/helicase Cas3
VVRFSEIAASFEFPALVLIEAPMGEGKTEAAMYLAEAAATRLQQPGCYFALPTQATSNQMFARVREFLERTAKGDVNLQLLHGHASLSAEFELLRNRVPETVPLAVDQAVPDQDGAPTIFAAEWFTYRKRGLLAPYGVGTIDQALLAVLKTPHFFVRMFGLTGKTVIIDEVHAYDAYMSTLLERLLEWLSALGSPVVLLSATLPAAKRDALLRAYMRGLGTSTELSETSPYPRITWVGPNGHGSRAILASERTRRELAVRAWTDGQDLGGELSRLLAEGGCAAVICNTVGRAQEVFAALAPFFPGMSEDGEPELLLFHARYPFDERDRREKLALVRFGKPGFEVELGDGTRRRVTRPHRGVLVATQVIEQSLDLDFDVMVTDFAPIDLLLQRAGRLHRHDRGSRPTRVAKPTLLIVAPQLDERGVPRFSVGTEAVYQPHLLLRSWLALQGRYSIAIPDDVEHLIELVYSDEKERPATSDTIRAYWAETEELLMQKLEEFKFLAKQNCIPRPHDEDLLASRSDLEEDNAEIHQSLQALTRISELPSVDVILMDNETAATFDPDETPDRAQALLYLRRSVRIAHRAVAPAIFNNPLLRPKGWRRSALLRHSRILRLDASGRIAVGNYTVSLNRELGIVIRREA